MAEQAEGVFQDAAEEEDPLLQAQALGFDFCQIEDVVDDVQQVS